MQWEGMKFFYHVAKAGSLTKAAGKLNLSQPALSRSISNFEKELGYAVFKRKKNGVELTDAGRELYDHARNMADSVKIAMHELKGDEQRIRGYLTVVTSPIIASNWIMEYLPGFKSQYPYIRPIIHSDETDFIGEKADVYISQFQAKAENYVQYYLGTLRSKLYASRTYLERYGVPCCPEQLDDHRIIGLSPVQSAALNSNFALRIGRGALPLRESYMEVDTIPSLLKAAELGMGIVELTQGYPASEGVDLVEVLSDFEGPEKDIFFITHKDKENIPRIRALLEYIKNESTRLDGIPYSKKNGSLFQGQTSLSSRKAITFSLN